MGTSDERFIKKSPIHPPPTLQKLRDLRMRAIGEFIEAALKLAVIDDPDCLANLPGHPSDQEAMVNLSYSVSIILRDNFLLQKTYDVTYPSEFTDGGPHDYEDWFESLFEILINKWGWSGYLCRYPSVYIDSYEEIMERFHDEDSDDVSAIAKRLQDLSDLDISVHVNQQAYENSEPFKALVRYFEHDPIEIIRSWMSEYVFPLATLNKAEFAALTAIKTNLFGAKSNIPRIGADAVKISKKRDRGKATQAVGVFISLMNQRAGGETPGPLPTLSEVAKLAGCSITTVSRATKEFRGRYQAMNVSRSPKGFKDADGNIEAWSDDEDEG